MNFRKRFDNLLPVIVPLFAAVMFIGLLSGNVLANGYDLCGNNEDFTSDFRINDCQFKTVGANPYFIMKPGYQIILESDEEMSVETVLCKTKTIRLDGRRIKTRVYEERAYEKDDGELVLVEISRNWFAICKQTNDVYYFGEDSRDCDADLYGGFDENDECCDEDSGECGKEVTTGSWEAGKDGARPGIMMPGTFLLGAKYFQETAPPNAVDRGENVAMGLDWPEVDPEYSGCVQVLDTNPAIGECGEDDAKIYCPGVGLVQDQDMELVESGFARCNKYIDDDDDDDDDD